MDAKSRATDLKRYKATSAHMNKYKTIIIDPPWYYANTLAVTGNAPGRTKQKGRSGVGYKTLSVDDIKSLPIKSLADTAGCHLYLWVTNKYVKQAYEIIEGWGFCQKYLLTWAKKPKGMIGFGAYSISSEFVLHAEYRPNKAFNVGRHNSTWFEASRRKHSQKPEAFYEIVEKVSPPPRLELFARHERPGWDVWGNEVNSTIELSSPHNNRLHSDQNPPR